jgi:hypothetical protein
MLCHRFGLKATPVMAPAGTFGVSPGKASEPETKKATAPMRRRPNAFSAKAAVADRPTAVPRSNAPTPRHPGKQ